MPRAPSSGSGSHPCLQCGKKFTRASDVTRHRKVHGDEREFQCTECSFKCNQFSSFKIHTDIHKGIRPYQCRGEFGCGKRFAESGALHKHRLRLHIGGYRCPHGCSSIVQTEERALHHLHTKHPESNATISFSQPDGKRGRKYVRPTLRSVDSRPSISSSSSSVPSLPPTPALTEASLPSDSSPSTPSSFPSPLPALEFEPSDKMIQDYSFTQSPLELDQLCGPIEALPFPLVPFTLECTSPGPFPQQNLEWMLESFGAYAPCEDIFVPQVIDPLVQVEFDSYPSFNLQPLGSIIPADAMPCERDIFGLDVGESPESFTVMLPTW